MKWHGLAALSLTALSLAACGSGGSSAGAPIVPAASTGIGAAAPSLVLAASNPITMNLAGADALFASGAASGVFVHACSSAVTARQARCHAWMYATAAATPAGLSPAQLQTAYGLTSSISGGTGRTVAIVDAYDDPNALIDLAAYRAKYGLPAPAFTKVNQNGGSALPAHSASWSEEISLDLDMVAANCPHCNILLVEANSASYSDLMTAEKYALAQPAVVAVSNSWGGGEFNGEQTYESLFAGNKSKVVTFSAGDGGYGTSYPATSQYVVAVGGTTLVTASTSRGWAEGVWSGSGSGCSGFIAKPAWQTDGGCRNRTDNDVSYDANPQTGVAVVDSYASPNAPWLVMGGTSAGAPAIAAIYALAGGGTNLTSRLYARGASLNDVTSGYDGSCSVSYLCTSAAGYDGPTGNGTPKGIAAF